MSSTIEYTIKHLSVYIRKVICFRNKLAPWGSDYLYIFIAFWVERSGQQIDANKSSKYHVMLMLLHPDIVTETYTHQRHTSGIGNHGSYNRLQSEKGLSTPMLNKGLVRVYLKRLSSKRDLDDLSLYKFL